MTSIHGQSRQEETTSVFGFWLTTGENIDFVTQNLANNRIFGDDFVDFRQSTPSYKYTSEEKLSFDIGFNHVYGSLMLGGIES